MIDLTKLNGDAIMVNAAQVETIERCPDTRVALMNGKQIYVQESPDAVREAMWQWLRSVQVGGWHGACETASEAGDGGEDRPA